MLDVHNKKIFLFGYYGKSNIGDDIMLLNLVHMIENKRPKRIYILVDSRFKLEESFSQDIVFIKGMKKNLFVLLNVLLTSHIFIWGGGTCFFDNPSTRGLNELRYFTRLRKLFNRRLKNLFIGIGVEKVEKNLLLIKKILANTDGVIVRDPVSAKNLLAINRQVNARMEFLEVYDDIVLTIYTKTRFKKYTDSVNEIQYITFSGHYKYTENNQVIEHTVKEIESILDKYQISHLYFLPSKYDEYGDNLFHYRLYQELQEKEKYNLKVVEVQSIEEYVKILRGANYHLGMRLHSLILADIFSIPKISLAYQQKIYQYERNSVDVMDQWGKLEFQSKNKNQLMSLLEKNTKDYESFFK